MTSCRTSLCRWGIRGTFPHVPPLPPVMLDMHAVPVMLHLTMNSKYNLHRVWVAMSLAAQHQYASRDAPIMLHGGCRGPALVLTIFAAAVIAAAACIGITTMLLLLLCPTGSCPVCLAGPRFRWWPPGPAAGVPLQQTLSGVPGTTGEVG